MATYLPLSLRAELCAKTILDLAHAVSLPTTSAPAQLSVLFNLLITPPKHKS